MSARVFVHPRCCAGPAAGALQAMLEERGYDMAKVFIGPEDKRRRRELVRRASEEQNGLSVFERMDGTRFEHLTGTPAPEYA